MESHAAEARAVFLQLQLFSPWLSQHHVIDVPGFLTNEERRFLFLFALGHGRSLEISVEKNEGSPIGNRVLCCRVAGMASSIPVRSGRNYPQNPCIQIKLPDFASLPQSWETKSPGGLPTDESMDYLA